MRVRQKFADKNQPVQKLHEATVSALRKGPVHDKMENLNLSESAPVPAHDRRITLGGFAIKLKAECINIADRFAISRGLSSISWVATVKFSGGLPEHNCKKFSKECKDFKELCEEETHPKLAVESILYFASIARLYHR